MASLRGTAALLLLFVACSRPGAQEPAAKAAELFSERCIGCHVPPDPAFAVERAWLTQVLDTA